MSPEIRFVGKVAVVTGAGRGLGRHYALELARRGAAVVVNDAGVAMDASGGSAEVAAAVAAEITAAGGRAVANSVNLREPGSASGLVKQAVDTFGRLDVVINNAGVAGPDKDLASCTDEEIAAVIDTNLWAAINLNRAAWPVMTAQHYGRIVNVASHSIFGVSHAAPYMIARSAHIGLTTALAAEGELVGIKVNAILPAAYTRMTEAIPNEDFRKLIEDLFQPETAAPIVVLLASDKVPCTGSLFATGGGFVARVALAVGTGTSGIGTAEEALKYFGDVADLSAPAFPQSIPDVMAHHVTGAMRTDYKGAPLDVFG